MVSSRMNIVPGPSHTFQGYRVEGILLRVLASDNLDIQHPFCPANTSRQPLSISPDQAMISHHPSYFHNPLLDTITPTSLVMVVTR